MKFSMMFLGITVLAASPAFITAMEDSKLQSKDGVFGKIDDLKINFNLREEGAPFTGIYNQTDGIVEARVEFKFQAYNSGVEKMGYFSVTMPACTKVTFTPLEASNIENYSITSISGSSFYQIPNNFTFSTTFTPVWHLHFMSESQLPKGKKVSRSRGSKILSLLAENSKEEIFQEKEIQKKSGFLKEENNLSERGSFFEDSVISRLDKETIPEKKILKIHETPLKGHNERVNDLYGMLKEKTRESQILPHALLDYFHKESWKDITKEDFQVFESAVSKLLAEHPGWEKLKSKVQVMKQTLLPTLSSSTEVRGILKQNDMKEEKKQEVHKSSLSKDAQVFVKKITELNSSPQYRKNGLEAWLNRCDYQSIKGEKEAIIEELQRLGWLKSEGEKQNTLINNNFTFIENSNKNNSLKEKIRFQTSQYASKNHEGHTSLKEFVGLFSCVEKISQNQDVHVLDNEVFGAGKKIETLVKIGKLYNVDNPHLTLAEVGQKMVEFVNGNKDFFNP